MPNPEAFAKVPPFPNDVHTVKLQRLELRKLLSRDAAESEAMFEVCTGLGFFLLDLRRCAEGETLLKEIEAGFKISQELSNLG